MARRGPHEAGGEGGRRGSGSGADQSSRITRTISQTNCRGYNGPVPRRAALVQQLASGALMTVMSSAIAAPAARTPTQQAMELELELELELEV